MFTIHRYNKLAALFAPETAYPGYKPNVTEIPNGDGKADAQKRYLHVAAKYNPPRFALAAFCDAYKASLEVAAALKLPDYLTPAWDQCALRVLEYPVGVGGEHHTDFDLFTLNLWRWPTLDTGAIMVGPHSVHFGELFQEFEFGEATPHQIPPQETEQRSIVFFALPRRDVLLPDGQRNVGEWLDERYARSRSYGK